MGYTYSDAIERAAYHVLELLRQRSELPYSTFYDGTEETSEELERILECECPAHALDLAVAQLEEQGVVETETRNELLADEEQDYWIRLTPRGHAWLKKPFHLEFRDAE